MTTNPDLDQAREWAKPVRPGHHPEAVAAARVIVSLPDEWIDADKLRELVEAWGQRFITSDADLLLSDLRALLPTPTPRTLADMTEEERQACRWMQAKQYGHTGNESETVVIAQVMDEWVWIICADGRIDTRMHEYVAPLPDLPRMVWPDEHHPDTDTDMSKSSPEIDMSRPHDDGVDMKPEDVPAGEVWVVSYGDGRAVGMREYSEYRPWYVMWDNQDLQIEGLWLRDKDITLVSRLVQEEKV